MLKNLLNKKKFDKTKYKELSRIEAEKLIQDNYGKYCDRYKAKKEEIKLSGYEYQQTYYSDPVEMYAGFIYQDMNERLRYGNCSRYVSEQMNWVIDSVIDMLEETIIMAPRLKEDVVLYRAVSKEKIRQIKKDMVDGIYEDKGFVSTTLSLENECDQFKYHAVQIKIYAERGTTALGIDNIRNRGELEILLPVNSKFEYIGKKRNVYEFRLINPQNRALVLDNYNERVNLMREVGYDYKNKMLKDVYGDIVNGYNMGDLSSELMQYYNDAAKDKLYEILHYEEPLKSDIYGYIQIGKDELENIEKDLDDGKFYKINKPRCAYVDEKEVEGVVLQLRFNVGFNVGKYNDRNGKEKIIFSDKTFIKSIVKKENYYEAELVSL